ncbi:MAG: hypothetical protein WBN20_00985, partial [Eudoraea sp.]|uniref:hypothetical protein n=1 Tax=Eudoraea sp. TaxID=1979955 RepID=UPI003C71FC10
MKTTINKSKIIVLLLLVALISFGCKEKATEKAPEAKKEVKEVKKYKMTTDIPESIQIEDELNTRIGKLEFEDGYPTQETADK